MKNNFTGNTYKVACFTGPRPSKLYGYANPEPYRPIIEVLKTTVRELCKIGCTTFVTGGAQGIDQLAFWAVDAVKKEMAQTGIKIENAVYYPFSHQSDCWPEYGMFGQNEYRLMLESADFTKCIAAENHINTTDKKGVIQALTIRNEEMVDVADVVIGLYGHNNDFRYASGGTANCLRYAFDKKDIWLIDPESLELIQKEGIQNDK